IAGSARSVGGDSEIVTALGPSGELQERLWAAAARGAAHRLDFGPLQNGRQKAAVFAGADHGRQAGGGADLLRVAVIELEAKRQPVVPDTINGGPGGGRGKKSGAILERVADGRRDAAQEEKNHPGAEAVVPARLVWGHATAG